jgi:ribosomal protein S27AE
MAGRHPQVRIGPPHPSMRNKHGATLTVTVHRRSGIRRNVTWPIILHRPLPTNSIIKAVVVHRRRRSDRWIWSAVFVCTCRVETHERTGPRIAINIGWRRTPAGVRVACVLPEGHISPEYVILPTRLVHGVQLCDKETSERDTDLIAMATMIQRLDLAGMPSELARSIHAVREAPRPSASSLLRLLHDWRESGAYWRPEDLESLDHWERRDRRRWHNREERRAWVSDARVYHYRQEVRRLVGGAREILINAHDMSDTARAGDNELPLPARRFRFIAAPSIFRLVLLNYARKIGTKVTVVERAHDTCVLCGSPLAPRDRAALWWKCGACGYIFDQDEHYCRLLLLEARSDYDTSGDVADMNVTAKE